MNHIKLFENFNADPLKELVDYLKAQNMKHEVVKTNDPQIEDDMVKLDGEFYIQITSEDPKPYALWNGMQILGEYKLPNVAVEMYKIEKDAKK